MPVVEHRALEIPYIDLCIEDENGNLSTFEQALQNLLHQSQDQQCPATVCLQGTTARCPANPISVNMDSVVGLVPDVLCVRLKRFRHKIGGSMSDNVWVPGAIDYPIVLDLPCMPGTQVCLCSHAPASLTKP